MSRYRKHLTALSGQWDIVASAEAAGVVAEDIRALGREDDLTVRTHPWLPPGGVVAFSPSCAMPFPSGDKTGATDSATIQAALDLDAPDWG